MIELSSFDVTFNRNLERGPRTPYRIESRPHTKNVRDSSDKLGRQDLFTDRCLLTCKNFLNLCKIKYYNGCLFHKVWKDFTAQTGDPTGTGSGGDSVYKFLFGDHACILDDPFDDPPQLKDLIPDASPEGKPKDDVRLEDDWVPMDEQLGVQELEEVLRAKEAHSRAVVLESVGDIPYAEIKPPDNVLFVCKLNPITEDEDLYTIFSRFGTVTSVEILRDYETGNSRCYAFVEFEDKKACEQAYHKMNNTLIDDRRIHIDFSQSVAKSWSQYRPTGQISTGKSWFSSSPGYH